MCSKMLLEVTVFLNDVHHELEDVEDDDHDVIHDVIPPLSCKVVMKKLRMAKLKAPKGRKMTV